MITVVGILFIDRSIFNEEKITLEAELFSLDGKERFHCKSSKDIKYAAELGMEIGCDQVMSAEDFNNINLSDFNGGFDSIIEASGAVPAIEKCMSLLRRHGICVYVGAAESTYELKIPHLELVATGKRLSGCLTGEVRPAVDLANLAKLYSAGRLPLDIFISNRRPLDELELAFDDLEKGIGLRTLIVWPEK